jgi:hypothetical protein
VAIVRASLDATQMFLPRLLQLSFETDGNISRRWSIRTQSFQKVNDPLTLVDLPFPRSVEIQHFMENKATELWKYEILDVKLNADIDPSFFLIDLQSLPAGTRVEDRVSSASSNSYIAGGKADVFRARAQRLYPPQSAGANNPPVGARVPRWEYAGMWIGVAASTGLLALAMYLRKRAT